MLYMYHHHYGDEEAGSNGAAQDEDATPAPAVCAAIANHANDGIAALTTTRDHGR